MLEILLAKRSQRCLFCLAANKIVPRQTFAVGFFSHFIIRRSERTGKHIKNIYYIRNKFAEKNISRIKTADENFQYMIFVSQVDCDKNALPENG